MIPTKASKTWKPFRPQKVWVPEEPWNTFHPKICFFFCGKNMGWFPPKMPGFSPSTFQVNHRLTLRAMHGLAEALALQGDFGPAEACEGWRFMFLNHGSWCCPITDIYVVPNPVMFSKYPSVFGCLYLPLCSPTIDSSHLNCPCGSSKITIHTGGKSPLFTIV